MSKWPWGYISPATFEFHCHIHSLQTQTSKKQLSIAYSPYNTTPLNPPPYPSQTYAFTEVAGIELKLIEHNRESKNCSFSREAKVSKKPRTLPRVGLFAH
jgi:hypothetical protein